MRSLPLPPPGEQPWGRGNHEGVAGEIPIRGDVESLRRERRSHEWKVPVAWWVLAGLQKLHIGWHKMFGYMVLITIGFCYELLVMKSVDGEISST
jgi:hypothetical protein